MGGGRRLSGLGFWLTSVAIRCQIQLQCPLWNLFFLVAAANLKAMIGTGIKVVRLDGR